jgi:hypothetical protein
MRFQSFSIIILSLLLVGSAGSAEAQAAVPSLEEHAQTEAFAALAAAGVQPPVPGARGLSAVKMQVAETPQGAGLVSGFKCLPTCSETDGRFLAVAGDNLITLSDPVLNLTIAVEAGATSFDLGIFDGDSNDSDALGNTHWDVGLPAEFTYTLFADPLADGTGTTVVELQPGFPSVSCTEMINNDWSTFTVATGPEAQAPSGNYFYVLRIELMNPAVTTLNSFKVRAADAFILQPASQPFSYYASWTNIADISIIYPGFPSLAPTTYDGTFRFFFDVFTSQQEVEVWDGDFDYGKFDGSVLDTDDPNTPGAPFLPPWATADANPEGIAIGLPGTTGNPADDRNGAGFGAYLLRSPSVQYDVLLPDGRTFHNTNPSGNQEWERFRVSTEPFDPATMDASTAGLMPAGTYGLLAYGVDMQNLNALFVDFTMLCVDEQGVPCDPVRPFLVGDTVFFDVDGDGIEDPEDPGIGGVVLELVDEFGQVIATTTTAGDGGYLFDVEAATLTVRLAPENFAPGGALEGMTITTPGAFGGTEQTDTVIDDNVLTYDFGLRQPGPGPGTGTIGYWKNHPEAWPVSTLVLGGVELSQQELLALLGAEPNGDASIILLRQLIAAWLNVFAGNDGSCIADTLAAADAWLLSGSGERSEAIELADILDRYNNGRLCAPRRK